MARQFNGSSQYLSAGPTYDIGSAFTISWFCRLDSDTDFVDIIGRRWSTFGRWDITRRASTDAIWLQTGDTSTNNHAFSNNTNVVDTDYWYCMRATGGNVFLYVNGALDKSVTYTAPGTDATEPLFIGAYNDRGTATRFWPGRISDVCVMSVDVGAASAIALSKGVSPLLVAPQSIDYYWNLRGANLTDYWGGNTLTNNSATLTDSKKIITPAPVFYSFPAAGAPPAANPKGPLGHPLHGPLRGPI